MSLNVKREEIYFRRIYRNLLEQKKITAIFRPGNRLNEHPKGLRVGETVTLRMIDGVGADWAQLAARLDPSFKMKAKIVSVKTKTLGELKKSDFEGSSPDVQSVYSLKYHLGVIYNLHPDELGPDSVVTITRFEYSD